MVQQVPQSGLSGNFPFRNLIINGDMKIAQRATGATTITNNSIDYATVDRWFVYESSGGVLTSEQHDMSAADQATTGQKKAMELNVTTADTSIASGEWCWFAQAVEAQFCQHALYGTSAAKTLTLSFYVKSNKTGTYAVVLDKNDSTRYRLPITYTIDSADTWEKKVIEFSPTAGSTSLITGANGAIADDNGVGFFVWWILVAGTDYHGTNNTWTSSGHYATSDQVNWLDSTDNNFHITGVQLEVGDQATDFEHLPHDVQLRRCQRYFYLHTSGAESNTSHVGTFSAYNSSTIQGSVFYPVQMRAAATADFVQSTDYFNAYGNGAVDAFVGWDLGSEGNKNGASIYTAGARGASVNQGSPYFVRVNGSTGATARVAFDAEL